MWSRVNLGSPYIMETLLLNDSGSPVSGSSIDYEIIESDSNTTVASGSLLEVGSGIYTGSFSFPKNEQYRILYTASGFPTWAEDVWVEETEETVGSIADMVGSINAATRRFSVIDWRLDPYPVTIEIRDAVYSLMKEFGLTTASFLEIKNEIKTAATDVASFVVRNPDAQKQWLALVRAVEKLEHKLDETHKEISVYRQINDKIDLEPIEKQIAMIEQSSRKHFEHIKKLDNKFEKVFDEVSKLEKYSEETKALSTETKEDILDVLKFQDKFKSISDELKEIRETFKDTSETSHSELEELSSKLDEISEEIRERSDIEISELSELKNSLVENSGFIESKSNELASQLSESNEINKEKIETFQESLYSLLNDVTTDSFSKLNKIETNISSQIENIENFDSDIFERLIKVEDSIHNIKEEMYPRIKELDSKLKKLKFLQNRLSLDEQRNISDVKRETKAILESLPKVMEGLAVEFNSKSKKLELEMAFLQKRLTEVETKNLNETKKLRKELERFSRKQKIKDNI